jgi:CHAT domain-containing protein
MKTYLIFLCYFFSSIIIAQERPSSNTVDVSKLTYSGIDSVMMIHYQKRDYAMAIAYMEAGQEKARSEFGEQDTTYALLTANLGFFKVEVGEMELAESLLLEARAIWKSIVGETHSEYTSCLMNLALLYQKIGKIEKTEALLLEVQRIFRRTLKEDDVGYLDLSNNLGGLYLMSGRYELAESLFLKVKGIVNKKMGEAHPYYAHILGNLAGLYQRMGKYELAEPLFLQAKELNKAHFGMKHPRYAADLSSLGALYEKMEDYEQAVLLLSESLKIRGETLGEEHPRYVNNLTRLAIVYKMIEKYQIAEPLYLKAKEKNLAIYGANSLYYAGCLSNLGKLYFSMGKYDLVEPLYLESKEIKKAVYGMTSFDYVNTVNNLAAFYLKTNRLDDAESCYWQAIVANCKEEHLDSIQLSQNWLLFAEKDFYFNSQIFETFYGLFLLNKIKYDSLGNKEFLKQGYIGLQTAMELNKRTKNEMTGEKDKLRILKKMNFLVKGAIASSLLLSENNEQEYLYDAFAYAEENKSILLADAFKGNRARNLGDLPDSLVLYELGLQKKKKELDKNRLQTGTAAEKEAVMAEINELNFEVQAFKNTLKDKYPKYHALKYENITAKAREIQELLSPNTMMVEYFISDTVTYLFAITPELVEVFPIPISLKKLTIHIRKFRTALSDYNMIGNNKSKAYGLYIQSAHWFYKELLGMAFKDKAIENLIIVADGELGNLPFEAFLVEPGKEQLEQYDKLHYLVNDYNISYNYSATLWKENLSKSQLSTATKKGELLACASAYPKLDSSVLQRRTPYLNKLRNALKPLPAAEKEIATLESIFQGDFLWGDSTNEKFFKEEARHYGIIHLAMHGVLHPRTAMLSSLAFTENGDSTEDNFLQAYEISRLKLNADLVVLSACETGYGEFEQGEGIVSLARSFMYAGTPSLVVSLWQVNDYSTAEIMKYFYQNLANGMQKDQALRQAKLYYIKIAEGIAAHPAFWSPFIQLGDSRSIELKAKGHEILWWIMSIGIVGLLVGGGFVLSRRKDSRG